MAELCSAQKERERKKKRGGRGRRHRRPDPSAERCGAAHCVGSGGRAGRAPLPMSVPFHCAPRRGHCASHRGHCAPEPTNVGDPCGRPAPRVARIHRTPGERSCAGVIETRNRSAWATLRFGANKFNHLSICAREGPLTGFLSFLYFLRRGGGEREDGRVERTAEDIGPYQRRSQRARARVCGAWRPSWASPISSCARACVCCGGGGRRRPRRPLPMTKPSCARPPKLGLT